MKTVMLVEDNENQRLLFEEELIEAGYNVITACDGHEALRKIEEQMPHIVVLDISMPGMNGIEALGKLLAKNNKLPVILHTAYGMYKDNFMTWAAEAYLIKSSDISQLTRTIKNVLDKIEQRESEREDG